MTVELRIDGLGSDGDGVGRLVDGRVVFVAGALPGDEVRVELASVRKKIQYANLLQILKPSPHRAESACHVNTCGGCALKHMQREAQLSHKRLRLIENLRRIGGVDAESLLGDVVAVGNGWGYRHRVKLHAKHTNKSWHLGYYERRSRRLAELSHCPILWPELEQVALRVAESISDLAQEAHISEVELVYSRRDRRACARIVIEGATGPWREPSAWFVDSGLSGAEIASAQATFRYGNLELRYDHKRASDFDLRFEPGVFTQAFPEMNDRLVEAVIDAVQPSRNPKVLELHAGIGNFSLPLARAGAQVVATEKNKRAAILCGRNARHMGVEIPVVACEDRQAIETHNDVDIIILDPPRTGAADCAQLLSQGTAIHNIVYVSCDSATLARDVGILKRGGFVLEQLQAFDMFPQTPHLEALAVLKRRGAL